jgi:hypothetical protein
MAVHIDESEGRLFVRYTSLDSREAVEDFVAKHGLLVDWSRVLTSSTGTINGRRVEQYRLPISTGVLGNLPAEFSAASFLIPLRQELEGDGFFRALRSDLEAGHEIQRVTFKTETGGKRARYEFVLSRLGALTTHEVPAGELPVENLLMRRRQRLAGAGDEALRVAFHLHRVGLLFRAFGSSSFRSALRALAAEVGGPRSIGRSSGDEPANQPALEALQLLLESKLRELVAGLTLDLTYRYDEAAAIVDDALAQLISTA